MEIKHFIMNRSNFKKDVRGKYRYFFRQLFAYFNLMINSFCKLYQCHDFQPQGLYNMKSAILNTTYSKATI